MSISGVNSKGIITTDDGRKYKKPDFATRYCGYAAGNAVASGVALGMNTVFSIPFIKSIANMPVNPAYGIAADKALISSGLAMKGVKIIDAIPSARPTVEKMFEKSLKGLDKTPELKNIVKKIYEHLVINPIFEGKNACYIPKANTIAVNKEKIGIAAMHEIGHAINKNISKFGNALQKMRNPFIMLGSLVTIIAFTKRPKADGEKPKGFIDKATTFIKNNAGKLTFLSLVPLLMEEGLASLNAAKLEKSLLDAKSLKRMNKFNVIAWMTYFGLALGVGIGTKLGVKLKDKIAKPKEIKQNA